jgi:hypothetical protein
MKQRNVICILKVIYSRLKVESNEKNRVLLFSNLLSPFHSFRAPQSNLKIHENFLFFFQINQFAQKNIWECESKLNNVIIRVHTALTYEKDNIDSNMNEFDSLHYQLIQ